ncbi:hypothetical protein TSMEX_006003 [Taenia solium]|eukprot:TsM_000789200 transcript=TsM_000789200 gene=TsM_000789200
MPIIARYLTRWKVICNHWGYASANSYQMLCALANFLLACLVKQITRK